MNRNGRGTKAFGAWCTTMFRKFFANEESRIPYPKFTVHDAPVWHLEQNARNDSEDPRVERDGSVGSVNAEVWDEFTGR